MIQDPHKTIKPTNPTPHKQMYPLVTYLTQRWNTLIEMVKEKVIKERNVCFFSYRSLRLIVLLRKSYSRRLHTFIVKVIQFHI